MKWLRRLAAILILAAAIATLWFAYAPLRDYHERQQGHYSQYQHDTGDPFAFIVASIELHHDIWIVLETLALVAFTATLWWSTRRLWQTSLTHAGHMETSAAEASRAAKAMEDVASGIADSVTNARAILDQQRDFSKRQMRPYLAIVNPRIIYQNMVEMNPSRWGIVVNVINTGHTPAHKIELWARVDILPMPLPAGYRFTMPAREFAKSGIINPGQNFFFRRQIDRLIWPNESVDIRYHNGTALYIFGRVKFVDTFGDKHWVNFCQFAVWDTAGNFSTLNTAEHNDAT